MEIRQFIDPKLSPDTSKKVLLGTMSLKLVAKEKTEPTIRRMSESTDLGDLVIDQTNDFLA